MAVALVLIATAPAWADPEGTCIELHCYCNGPDQPDTVASCDTTCEAVCGSSGGGLASSAARAAHLARWSLTALLGPSYTSHDAAGGSSVPDGGSYGAELDARFGRPSVGIFVRFALTSTPIEGPGVGLPRERALAFDWFGIGLEVSPRLLGGRSWELRPTAGAWITSTTLLACDGCEASVASGAYDDSYGAWGWGARVGFDLYLGSLKRHGLSVALVYSQSQVGDLHAYELLPNTPTEHIAPTYMLQVGLTSMP